MMMVMIIRLTVIIIIIIIIIITLKVPKRVIYSSLIHHIGSNQLYNYTITQRHEKHRQTN